MDEIPLTYADIDMLYYVINYVIDKYHIYPCGAIYQDGCEWVVTFEGRTRPDPGNVYMGCDGVHDCTVEKGKDSNGPYTFWIMRLIFK